MNPYDDWSLEDAKAWLRERLNDGATCPCCQQRAQIYRRKINSGMARALLEQWRVARQDVVHTRGLWKDYTHEGGQLAWWGLIEQDPMRRDDGGKSGWWRITDDGRRFIHNRLLVPKYARIYDSRLMGFDHTKQVSIIDALGTRFDYHELMQGR